MKIKIPLLLIVVILPAMPAAPAGDLFHRRDSLEIHSEIVLSGIVLEHDKIDRVIERLGKPSRVAVAPDAEQPTVNVYEWETKTCSLRLTALNETTWSDIKGTIMSIDVLGAHPDAEVGTTGRGLKLGDAISDVRRLYGLRLYLGVTLPENYRSPWWIRPSALGSGPILTIDFDDRGGVNHMKLTNFCMAECW